jgi:NAD-dependent SIR2 family protein deacetylase
MGKQTSVHEKHWEIIYANCLDCGIELEKHDEKSVEGEILYCSCCGNAYLNLPNDPYIKTLGNINSVIRSKTSFKLVHNNYNTIMAPTINGENNVQ